MEKISKIIDKARLPVEIKVLPYMLDHQFEGKSVLPAVEAMQILAVSTQSHLPDIQITSILDTKFDKFLFISPDDKSITAFNKIEVREDGHIISKLITKTLPKKTSITRVKEHVTLSFARIGRTTEKRPFDRDTILGKNSFKIPPERLYRDLVPFGPAYHNVENLLCLSERGAIAMVGGGSFVSSNVFPLGSPFPLDAAFHMACAWGQRYSHVVAFPVGLKERHIFRPTRPGKSYTAVLIPIQKDPNLLIFDIWLYGKNGEVYEGVLGVRMRDVSARRMQPPPWILT
ncbi:MAG: polyketide synthase dehydratase domain-containing protein [Deltaproteobacteria bacterium]|nr:polyketide synthase dehydratase domain-containing protein [Deltaproteobacteria bacterium]